MEQALERRVQAIRTQPREWFTPEAVREQIRQRHLAAAQLFLSNGYSPEEVAALTSEEEGR